MRSAESERIFKECGSCVSDGLGDVARHERAVASPTWTAADIGYALVVGAVMTVTSAIGWLSVHTDPTWIANAALMVIGPDVKQLGYKGIQRALGTVLGVIVGFGLVDVVPVSGPVCVITTGVVSFLVIATMDVNYVFLTFFWTLFMSLGWGELGGEHHRAAGIERIVAESLGIVIAIAAVFALHRLLTTQEQKRRASLEVLP